LLVKQLIINALTNKRMNDFTVNYLAHLIIFVKLHMEFITEQKVLNDLFGNEMTYIIPEYQRQIIL
jgi:hypothetical protein